MVSLDASSECVDFLTSTVHDCVQLLYFPPICCFAVRVSSSKISHYAVRVVLSCGVVRFGTKPEPHNRKSAGNKVLRMQGIQWIMK